MQILNGILLEAFDNRLKLTATDLKIGIETYVDCNVIEEGSIVLNARIFGDIVKKLPNSLISISVEENRVNIQCENSVFNLFGSNPLEYPKLPTIINQTSFSMAKDLLKSAIRHTVFATTEDETRPILAGVLLEVHEGGAAFVALDGYRLALRNIPVDLDENIKIVIPSRALTELSRILDDSDEEVSIVVAPGHVIFNMGETLLFSRLLEGQFLNYKEIIRTEHKTTVLVNKEEFQDSLERASLLSSETKANLIKLTIGDDKITIRSNSEMGNVHEEVFSKLDGEELNIAFNSRYILDGVKIIESEEIELSFMGELNPCIIKPVGDANYTYLALPVRLAQEDY